MQTEHEIKILDIDVGTLKKKLQQLGAQHLGKQHFTRNTYDLDTIHKWLRLRTDGNHTTLAFKEREHDGIDGTKELELEVDDFTTAEELLAKLGYQHKNVQENHRESYLLDNVHVDIDTWPGIPPYLEIEGKNQQAVLSIVEQLGFTKSQTTTMNTYQVYNHYGKDVAKKQELRF